MAQAETAATVTELPDLQRIKDVFARQQKQAIRLRQSTAAERIAKIERLKQAMEDHREEIREACHQDFRKTEVETDLNEILTVLSECNDAIRHLRRWMRPKRVLPTQLMMGTSAWIQPQPKGTSLIIAPWNFPFTLMLGPLVSALAAGCTAILKPSEMTPHSSALMARMVREIFPEDEVALFEGDARTSTALLEQPFDHIFFTGAPAIGKIVMEAAAKNLSSVTLELGGKSPTIVDKTADIDLAARNIMFGKLTNSGQICIAPDYLFVHEAVKDQFVARCIEVIQERYGDTADAQSRSPNLTHIVNERHTKRIGALLEDATNRGARVITGGEVRADEAFIQPTLIDNIPEDAEILKEEIFGPLFPILSFRELDDVISYINERPKPLALYIWSGNDDNIRRVMEETTSGGACINHTLVHFLHARLPFGGVNNSGIGAAHGEFGFREFSHMRAVVKTRFMMARMLFPPYNAFKLLFIRLTKYFV